MEFGIMMINIIPLDTLIEELEKAIAEYKITPSDLMKRKAMYSLAAMMMIKGSIEVKGLKYVSEEIEKNKIFSQMFKDKIN